MNLGNLKSEDLIESPVLIDGSHGEGGGQIIRNAVTYACVLRRKINVINIRANRPNPGLASQHLESIKAMLRISGATTNKDKELKKQATEFDMDGSISLYSMEDGANINIDLLTAGSCTLCIQCVLPYLICLGSPSHVRIIGGTHVMKSPSFDYLERVFIPNINKLLGHNVKACLRNPGYFPRGGGCIMLELDPKKKNFLDRKFTPFNLTERGSLIKIDAILNVTPGMKDQIPKFKTTISSDTNNIEVRTVSYASIEYFLQFQQSYVGFSHLVEGRNPDADQLLQGIQKIQQEMKSFLESTAAVDGYMQDQLIIYMALAKLNNSSEAVSRIRTINLTDHTTSAIHVSQLFGLPSQFIIEKIDDKTFDIVL